MSPYASLPGGATLFYTDEEPTTPGEEPLLLVHGWTCDSNDYLWQIAHFRATRRVIAPDLRGHGRSAVLADGYEARIFARDLLELLDRLAIERCVAVGHSLGGLIVSVMAVEYPERVRAVICLDPAYGVADGAELDGCLALIDGFNQPDWPWTLARAFATWERPSTPPYFRELHVRRMLAMDATVVRETFRLLFVGPDPLARRARSERYLAGRTCPVLVLAALDARARVAWEMATARHPASLFVHLPLGHWLQQEAPDLINQWLEEWLNSLDVYAEQER